MDQLDKIAQQLQRIFSGGDPSANDTGFKFGDYRLIAEQAYNKLIADDYKLNSGTEGIHNVGSQFLTEFYGIPVTTNASRGGARCVELPSSFVNLPNGKGVNEVYGYHKKLPIYFTPLPSSSASLLKGLWATDCFKYAYTLDGACLYLTEGDCAVILDKLNIKLVIGNPKTVGADQELAILGIATQMMAQKRPEDNVNDNNDTR